MHLLPRTFCCLVLLAFTLVGCSVDKPSHDTGSSTVKRQDKRRLVFVTDEEWKETIPKMQAARKYFHSLGGEEWEPGSSEGSYSTDSKHKMEFVEAIQRTVMVALDGLRAHESPEGPYRPLQRDDWDAIRFSRTTENQGDPALRRKDSFRDFGLNAGLWLGTGLSFLQSAFPGPPCRVGVDDVSTAELFYAWVPLGDIKQKKFRIQQAEYPGNVDETSFLRLRTMVTRFCREGDIHYRVSFWGQRRFDSEGSSIAQWPPQEKFTFRSFEE